MTSSMRTANQTTETSKWSRRYESALRKHLESGREVILRQVQLLGRQAVALGLETLDLAKAHRHALSTLLSPHVSSRTREGTIKRAQTFFAEAATRIENTHRAAIEADALIHQLNEKLRQRTRESAVSTLSLKRSVLRRREAETALKKSGERHARLLTESHLLLKQLRDLTHAYLSAQEGSRKSVSSRLRDDIGQGLLGIHLRLLTLKRAMKASTQSLQKELAETQKLVKISKTRVNRLVHDHGIQSKA